MAKAGRVQHWKHGWIPISPEAKAYAAGKGPRPLSTGDVKPPAKALARAKARQAAFKAAQAAKPTDDDVTSMPVGDYRFTKVKGYPEVQFKEILEVDRRPPEQYREVAKIVSDVLKPYPRAAEDPILIGWSDELADSVMADTDSRGGFIGHRIRLNPHMWDQPGEIMTQVADMKSRKWGIFADAPDPETFRRDVITHEIGHVLMGREDDEHASHYSYTYGQMYQFARELVTPREVGLTEADDGHRKHAVRKPGTAPPSVLDEKVPRWSVDSLNKRSVYALTNEYEFFAEAFLDGTINGDKASESGKRAVALARKIFGSEGTFQ